MTFNEKVIVNLLMYKKYNVLIIIILKDRKHFCINVIKNKKKSLHFEIMYILLSFL